MINLIIFDLDGVLIKAKEIHYNALNQALNSISNTYEISLDEHLGVFDGLDTKKKLSLLTEQKGLPIEKHEDVWKLKQRITIDLFESIVPNENLITLFKQLSFQGFKLACCSNSIRKTVFVALSKLGIIQYFDLILSNEDVKTPKPHPEIYWTAMSNLREVPENTLIVEDSPNGLKAAHRSGAKVLRVENPDMVTLNKIMTAVDNFKAGNNNKWVDDKLNILIPMAGAGSRFEAAGYVFPKPLIQVNGKPMIQTVVENLNIDANYIYIVQKKHNKKYNLKSMLNLITPNCKVIEVDGLTEGAACTTLLAKEFINNDNPLLMANSDQFVEWSSSDFMYKVNETGVDASILTFESTHPKWSFAKLNSNGFVEEVAEKNPISNLATVGIYFWKHGKDYVKYASQMIDKNIRVNGEFYVCPVFNEAILDNKNISVFNIDRMWGIGTPEDLDYFHDNYEF